MKKITAVVMLYFFILSCFPVGLSGKDVKSAGDTAELFYKLIMWKYYDRAIQFVAPEKREEYEKFVLQYEDDLNITSFELKEVIFIGEEGEESTIRVQLKYYTYPSVSIKTIILEDRWFKEEKQWYIDSDFDYELTDQQQ